MAAVDYVISDDGHDYTLARLTLLANDPASPLKVCVWDGDRDRPPTTGGSGLGVALGRPGQAARGEDARRPTCAGLPATLHVISAAPQPHTRAPSASVGLPRSVLPSMHPNGYHRRAAAS